MKLKLTDKIKKFFGTRATDGDEPYQGIQQLPRVDGLTQQYERSITGDEVYRDGGETFLSSSQPLGHGSLQHAGDRVPSTLSQKADLTSNPRTTGQNEAYCVQNEVYFPQLILTLQTGTAEQKAVAAEALFNYTAESDTARQRATHAGVVTHLIELLTSGTDHGKMYAAYTLSSLTSIEEALEQMCLLGAIPALISILATCPLLVCKKGAMRALGRLARNDKAAADIVAANGLVPIISLLNRPDSSLVRRCLIALYFIGADKDALQQAIGAAGALPRLLALAQGDSPDVQAEATDVIKVLCRNAACGRSLAESGGTEVLVGLVHNGLTSRTKASAARALQRLSDNPELKELLANSSAREILCEGSSFSSLLNTCAASPAYFSATAVPPQDSATIAAIPSSLGGSNQPATSARRSPPAAALQGAGGDKIGVAKEQSADIAVTQAAETTERRLAQQASISMSGAAVAVEVDDVKQLAELLAGRSNKWLREKAAAAIEQLTVDDHEACRELADMGALGSLLDMLAASNSSITRRAGARALGRLGDDAVLLRRMAEPGFILKLLQAAPELSGSALQAVMKLLQALASNESTCSAFPKQSCAAHLMQVIEGMQPGLSNNVTDSNVAAAATEVKYKEPGAADSSKELTIGGSDEKSFDAAAAVRAVDVLLMLGRADPVVLAHIKQYPGGFRLLVSKLQYAPTSLASPILQLLALLAKSEAHQEDLLKGGVVPVLLGLYRSDDASIAMQAAKVMELLSEPAAQILERSLSKAELALMPAASGNTAKLEAARASSPLAGSTSGVQGSSYSSTARNNSSSLGLRGSNQVDCSNEAAVGDISKQPAGQQIAASVQLGSPGRGSSVVGAVDAAARLGPRASSIANNSTSAAATSRNHAGRASRSFTDKQKGVMQLPQSSDGSSSNLSKEQQQQQRQQEQAAGSPYRRSVTPEAGNNNSRQEAAAAPTTAVAASGTSSPFAEGAAAVAGAFRGAAGNKERQHAAGAAEHPGRPASGASKGRAEAAQRTNAGTAAASPRQRPLANKRPTSPSIVKEASASVQAAGEATGQQIQQPPPAVAGVAEAAPAGQGSAAGVQGHARSSSPQRLPPKQQQQQQQLCQQQQHVAQGSLCPGCSPADNALPAAAGPSAPNAPPAAAAAGVAVDNNGSIPPGNCTATAEAAAGPLAKAASSSASPPKVLPNVVAAAAAATAADADDLLSSTYDNLHGLLMKKSDIEICRTAEGRKCRLGEGGFGVVYKAVMNGVDEVAVKLVKADSPSRKELELFLKEVQTLAKLHHRNIVQFYGACLETGSMFFVTELMKGGDLYTALRHHSETMKWERLGRKVALDVALGLNYLHAQRPPMMHRDLKSPNVLLSEEGVAKIADVGMVRSQVKDLVTAQPVMTPLWAAPEVVRHERASIKADIWSYGILIWELVSGEDITEYQPLSISRQVGPSPNAKAINLPAKCPAVARKLFTACTQMDPERRPGAQTLVEWLRADMAQNRF